MGARLEAEETLRKRQEQREQNPQEPAAAELQRWKEQQLRSHHPLTHRGSSNPSLPFSPPRPERGLSTSPLRADDDQLSEDKYSESPFAPMPPHEIAELRAQHPTTCATSVRGKAQEPGFEDPTRQHEAGNDPLPETQHVVAFAALRQREIVELRGDPVAILDDRMARARPTGPVALSVSANAVVHSTSAQLFRHDRSTATYGHRVGGGREREVLALSSSADKSRGSGYGGLRPRRLSLPLMPIVVGPEGGVVEGTRGQEGTRGDRKRPYTTSDFGRPGGWANAGDNQRPGMGPIR